MGATGNAGYEPGVKKRRLPVVLLFCFVVAGVLLRILGGNRIVLTDLIYSPGVLKTFPGTKTPENSARSFYLHIDRGEYDRAWELSLEPDWTGPDTDELFFREVAKDPGSFRGWTPKDRFIERNTWELGADGTGVTLKSVEARILRAVDTQEYAKRYGIDGLEKAYLLTVTGRLLGSCSLLRFRTSLTVLVIDGENRVLLSGTKPKDSYFYESWFSDITISGSIWEQ
ncbi:MAG: hypothetical protein JXQ30_13990 [Spirochaetes bacterium]|nr:hypothetical protein [Spirochaetota bacterium]